MMENNGKVTMRFSTRIAICSSLAALLLGIPATAQGQSQGKLYNRAKQKLMEGKQVNGHSIGEFNPKRYCQEAPHYDFMWFEMQHSTISYADVANMIAACPKAGAAPFIRIPEPTEGDIQKATDLGALGIVVPTVDTTEKAQDAAKWARYPPVGRRSQGGGQARRVWEGIDYRATFNDNMLVVLMIETPVGVSNAYDIAKTPGVDVVIIGNSDLASFSGYPRDHPRYEQMLTDVRDAVIKAGKYFGTASANYREGHPLSKDVKFTQSGPPNDGWTPPSE